MTIEHSIKQLLEVVGQLKKDHERTGRNFTLDGKLVGDIGEVLVEMAYQLELVPSHSKGYDAKCADGRLVQIKTTMKNYFYMRNSNIPYFFVAIAIDLEGNFREIFNGPGEKVWQQFGGREGSREIQFSGKRLIELNKTVIPEERIPLRVGFTRDTNGNIHRTMS